MKNDALPPTVEDLVAFAIERGFFQHDRVGSLTCPVISIDESKDLIRFFSPEVLVRPWGSQLGGNLGLGLRTGESYPIAVYDHVLNYRDFVGADRTVDSSSNLDVLLKLLRRHLADLPATIPEVLAWAADGKTWLGKFVRWGKPHAVAFVDQARRMHSI
jgi:hypothetical protein